MSCSLRHWGYLGLALVLIGSGSIAHAQGIEQFNLPAQSLAESLRAVGTQTHLNVLFDPPLVASYKAPALSARVSASEALQKLLAHTPFRHRFVDERTVVLLTKKDAREGVKPSAEAGKMGWARVAQVDGNGETAGSGVVGRSSAHEEGQSEDAKRQRVEKSQEEEDPERSGIPEILVTGSKLSTLNTDIRRTEDDAQPYVIFDRSEIERSGALNLEDFFKTKLTMSVSSDSASQSPSATGNVSRINLRGLGSDETLMLVDGRRMAGLNFSGTPQQADINGIPLAAIERIEVLPTTASGIYGGGATGGVVNVILRRDYSGLGVKLTYGNTFTTDVANRSVDISAGMSLENGRTNILFTGGYKDSNPLLSQERSLVQRGRQHVLNNNPDFFFASSIPPLGATPNIRSFDGTALDLKDGTSLGSPITYIPPGYAGAAVDGGAALVANAGQYNLDLSNSAQSFGGGNHALLNSPTVESFMLTLRRELTSTIDSFVEIGTTKNSGRYIRNFVSVFPVLIPADAPNNPFLQEIAVSVPTVGADAMLQSDYESQRAIVGTILQLPMEWKAELDLTWNRSRFSFFFPPNIANGVLDQVNSGAIDVLRDLNLFPIDYGPLLGRPTFSSPTDAVLRSSTARVAGPLPWSLPAGDISIGGLIEYRKDLFDESLVTSTSRRLTPSRSQAVGSAYLEARIPVYTAANRRPGVELLELQLAARRDSYHVKGTNSQINPDVPSPTPIVRYTQDLSSIDPTLGLRYKPVSDLAVRASYGTGFLPPSVHQLAPQFEDRSVAAGHLTDPRRGGEALRTVTLSGRGSGDLRPEESRSWSAGVVATPRSIAGLRVSLDWTDIEKQDNISSVTSLDQGMFDIEDLVPGAITRAPVGDGDPYAVGTVTGVNMGLFNVARLRAKAVDFAVDYETGATRLGQFSLSVAATKLLSLETQLTDAAPVAENAGVSTFLSAAEAGGLKWRANGTLTWQYANWSLGWTTRFYDSYYLNVARTVDQSQGSATVPSQIYHDAFGVYRFNAAGGALSGILSNSEIQFGVSNVFNKLPPVDVLVGRSNGLYYSRWADPRLASYYLSVSKSFAGAGK